DRRHRGNGDPDRARHPHGGQGRHARAAQLRGRAPDRRLHHARGNGRGFPRPHLLRRRMADDKLPVIALPTGMPGQGCSRRQLMRGAALAACAPAVGALVGCGRIPPDRDVNVGAPVDGKLVLSTSDVRELARAGGAIVAMSALCPHANCEIAWVEKDRQAECPCHGSRFAGDGTVLSGPAVTDLQTYPAILDASGSVVVNLFAGDKVFPPVTNGSVVIDLAEPKYRTLQSPGGAVVGHPDGAPSPIVVTRPDPPVTAQGGFLV